MSFWSFILDAPKYHKHRSICCLQMVYYEGKNALNLISAGAPPRTPGEEGEGLPPEPLLRHFRHKILNPPLGAPPLNAQVWHRHCIAHIQASEVFFL